MVLAACLRKEGRRPVTEKGQKRRDSKEGFGAQVKRWKRKKARKNNEQIERRIMRRKEGKGMRRKEGKGTKRKRLKKRFGHT